MDSVILKRGNSEIELQKSSQTLGLHTIGGSTISEIMPEVDSKLKWMATSKVLGGFKVINIEDVEDIDPVLDQIREHESIDVATHVYHTPDSKVPFVPTGKITLRFSPETTEKVKAGILDKYKLLILESRQKKKPGGDIKETFIVSVTPMSMNPVKVAYELQQLPSIHLAEPDLSTPGKLHGFVMPGDELLIEQWHLQNTGIQFGSSLGLKLGADARVVNAWKNMGSLGSAECVVAIIDDGFDLEHPDLTGEGKIVAPWDFQTKSPDPTPKNITPFDGDYHGTACAGIAVGSYNNKGILGVAPACKLMPVRWGVNISDDSIEAWFGHVVENGAWVVSCSWGALAPNNVLSTRQNEAIEDCVNLGRNGLGCVVVFAAGNSGLDINDPKKGYVNGFAVHPDVIAVSACNSLDQRSEYSNFGKEITVCAPSDGQGGRGLLTADLRGKFSFQGIEYVAGYDAGDYTRLFGGTSGAAPVVAGVCALMLSHNPLLSAAEIKEILKTSSRKIGETSDYKNGHSIYHGHGCIDAEAAIDHISK